MNNLMKLNYQFFKISTNYTYYPDNVLIYFPKKERNVDINLGKTHSKHWVKLVWEKKLQRNRLFCLLKKTINMFSNNVIQPELSKQIFFDF